MNDQVLISEAWADFGWLAAVPEHPNRYIMTGGHFRVCARLLKGAEAQPEASWSILTSILNRQL
jgi:hypothetical protein